jgi:L-fuconolactonase
MLIDTHHHFWKYRPEEFGWMDDSMKALQTDFLPEHLQPLLGKCGISGTVVVQARQSLQETAWLLDLGRKHDFIQGVVGWMDLCSPRLDEQLDAYAHDPMLVGLRHVVHDEPDDDFMLRPDFQRGVSRLHAFGLVYDLLLFPRHLTRAIRLARTLPGQRFVLDHLGKPAIRSGEMQPWETDLKALAALPNVWCKLSGMVTEADHVSWKAEDFIPYMSVILDAFGSGRVMLGSDWPVCTLAGDYGQVLGIALEYIGRLDPEEKRKIEFKNAIDFYQLQTPSDGKEEV